MKSRFSKSLAFCMVFIGMTVCRGQAVQSLPVEVSPSTSGIRYSGRFDWGDPAGPRCSWSGSSVRIRFKGTALNVVLQAYPGEGMNFWQVVVDGEPSGVLSVEDGEHLYGVVCGLPEGEHLVELSKRTEFRLGTTQIRGFQLSAGGEILPLEERVRGIEVIGDSISCGYGNEATKKEEPFTAATENGWAAYGAAAAREMDADYVCVAWSGKKLWPDNSIIEHYGRVLSLPETSEWDFSSWQPDVVVINLGTNDFYAANPEERGWIAAYKELLARIRKNYPEAWIYCAVGPMLGDWPEDRKPGRAIRSYLNKLMEQSALSGIEKIRLIDFGLQNIEDSPGADWHPGLKTHRLMAEQLKDALRKDLGW